VRNRKKVDLLILFVGLSMLFLLTGPPVTAIVKSTTECEGNACSVTTMTWDQERQQFKVENSSNQNVKVTVTTFAGTSSVVVEPQKHNYLEVKTFNGPYLAAFQ
jgi:hypothetical protein